MANRPTFNRLQRQMEQLAEAFRVRAPKCTIVCHCGEDLRLVADKYFEECPDRRGCEPQFIQYLFAPRPELCTRESIAEYLPDAHSLISSRAGDPSLGPAARAAAAEQDAATWRGLCERFGVGVDRTST